MQNYLLCKENCWYLLLRDNMPCCSIPLKPTMMLRQILCLYCKTKYLYYNGLLANRDFRNLSAIFSCEMLLRKYSAPSVRAKKHNAESDGLNKFFFYCLSFVFRRSFKRRLKKEGRSMANIMSNFTMIMPHNTFPKVIPRNPFI